MLYEVITHHLRPPLVEKGQHVGDVAFPDLGPKHLVAENHDADSLRHILTLQKTRKNRIIVQNAGGKSIDIAQRESVTWECILGSFYGKNRVITSYSIHYTKLYDMS